MSDRSTEHLLPENVSLVALLGLGLFESGLTTFLLFHGQAITCGVLSDALKEMLGALDRLGDHAHQMQRSCVVQCWNKVSGFLNAAPGWEDCDIRARVLDLVASPSAPTFTFSSVDHLVSSTSRLLSSIHEFRLTARGTIMFVCGTMETMAAVPRDDLKGRVEEPDIVLGMARDLDAAFRIRDPPLDDGAWFNVFWRAYTSGSVDDLATKLGIDPYEAVAADMDAEIEAGVEDDTVEDDAAGGDAVGDDDAAIEDDAAWNSKMRARLAELSGSILDAVASVGQSLRST